MHVEPTYRINHEQAQEVDVHVDGSWHVENIKRMIEGGVLVPDSRLQDIADAWSEYISSSPGVAADDARIKLHVKLDALTQKADGSHGQAYCDDTECCDKFDYGVNND